MTAVLVSRGANGAKPVMSSPPDRRPEGPALLGDVMFVSCDDVTGYPPLPLLPLPSLPRVILALMPMISWPLCIYHVESYDLRGEVKSGVMLRLSFAFKKALWELLRTFSHLQFFVPFLCPFVTVKALGITRFLWMFCPQLQCFISTEKDVVFMLMNAFSFLALTVCSRAYLCTKVHLCVDAPLHFSLALVYAIAFIA